MVAMGGNPFRDAQVQHGHAGEIDRPEAGDRPNRMAGREQWRHQDEGESEGEHPDRVPPADGIPHCPGISPRRDERFDHRPKERGEERHGASDREEHHRRIRDQNRGADQHLQKEYQGNHGARCDAGRKPTKDGGAGEGGDGVDAAVTDGQQEIPALVEAVSVAGHKGEAVPEDGSPKRGEKREQQQRPYGGGGRVRGRGWDRGRRHRKHDRRSTWSVSSSRRCELAVAESVTALWRGSEKGRSVRQRPRPWRAALGYHFARIRAFSSVG